MKKGYWVHGAKFNSLGAGSQKVNLPAKTLKIAVFRPGPPQDVKNFPFFSKTLVWDSFRTFKTLTACPPDITLYTTVLQYVRKQPVIPHDANLLLKLNVMVVILFLNSLRFLN